MDPITLIVTALSAGLAAGTQQASTQAITDSYNRLKAFLQRRFTGKQKALDTLADYETDPDTYEKPLQKTLMEVGINETQDGELIAAAQHLLTLIQPQQAGMGKFTIQNTGTVQGQVIGDHTQVAQQFGDARKG